MTFKVGQHVLVPNVLVGRTDAPEAISTYKISEVGAGRREKKYQRSVRVNLPNGSQCWVSSARVHENVGLYLVRVGDLSSEVGLLDPLAKSLRHFFRLLIDDSTFHLVYLRTVNEFAQFLSSAHLNVSHLILIAHGRRDGIRFVGESGVEDWRAPDVFVEQLRLHKPRSPIHFVSLACDTGYSEFAGLLSTSDHCQSATGPHNAVHGAIASQFCQRLFLEHLLHGTTWQVSVRKARQATPGTASFRMWQKGKLVKVH